MRIERARTAGHERNRAGRDFAAGDIHGCYRTLERALAGVGFEPGRDRLFSAGDLVNRGPHSTEALEWLEDGRIEEAVLGNHEAMVLRTLMNRERRARTGWIGELDDERTERWIGALWRLPLAMTVATEHGEVGIAHAGVVDRSWRRTIDGIERRDQAVISTVLLGGHGSEWRGTPGTPIEGVRAVVTGHEPVHEARSDGAWWQIDTGAGFAGFNRLTLLRIDCAPMETYTLDAVSEERVDRNTD